MMPNGQEDPNNNIMIQKYGCCLWSHWKWVEMINGHMIFQTSKIVNSEYEKLLHNGIKEIDEDCTVEDGVQLFSCYGIRVRTFYDPITKSAWVSPGYKPSPGQIIILCFHWQKDTKTEYIHFAPGTVDKDVLEDPIARGSNTIKNGYLHSLRLYDLI